MKTNRFCKYLRGLNPKSKKEFLNFVKSPYHNKNKSLIRFAEIGCQSKNNVWDNRELFHQIFPKTPFNLAVWKNLNSKALQVLTAFFAAQELYNSPSEVGLKALNYAFKNENLDNYIEFKEKKVRKRIQEIPESNVKQQRSFQLLQLLLQKQAQKGFDEQDLELFKNTQLALKQQTQLQVYRYLFKQIGYSQTTDIALETHQILAVLELLSKGQKATNTSPSLIGYQLLQRLYESKSRVQFQKTVHFLEENASSLAPSQLLDFLIPLIQFGMHQFQNGQVDYARQVFSLFQVYLDWDLLHLNGSIHQPLFKDMIKVSCFLGYLEWAERLLEQINAPHSPTTTAPYITHCQALLLLHQDQIDQAILLLNKVKLDHPYDFIDSKQVLIQAYYLQEEEDLLHYTLEAFRVWLNRQKQISAKQRTANLQFIRCFRAMHRIERTLDKEKRSRQLEKWYEEIKSMPLLANKPSLLQILQKEILLYN